MEQIYALGVSCIQLVQEWLPYEGYFSVVNELSNPYHASEILFPLVSILDSVFAAQLLLCIAFSGWTISVIKWWILEDRPYWWVRETSYYREDERPRLLQTHQTCETGPGCPSGHSATMAVIVTLIVMSAAHVANDRKWQIPWFVQKAAYATFLVALLSVFFARLYVSVHFPHQCMLGALVVSLQQELYPYQKSGQSFAPLLRQRGTNQQTFRIDNIKAFRWCESPEHLHVSTTPVFALVQCTGYLMGWAIAVTPDVAQYRHNTPNRSLIISMLATAVTMYGYQHLNEQICKANTFQYYATKFLLYVLKPMFFLRLIPAMSMWPFSSSIIKDKIE